MTFLDTKGGTVKEGLGSNKNDTAVRLVRAKREAFEAGASFASVGDPVSLQPQTKNTEKVFIGSKPCEFGG